MEYKWKIMCCLFLTKFKKLKQYLKNTLIPHLFLAMIFLADGKINFQNCKIFSTIDEKFTHRLLFSTFYDILSRLRICLMVRLNNINMIDMTA